MLSCVLTPSQAHSSAFIFHARENESSVPVIMCSVIRLLCRISYCSADATHDHVFAFIATNLNETMECHAFLCPKRKMAQTVTLTVAQAFNTAYQAWQLSQSDPRIHHAQEKSPPLTGDGIGEDALRIRALARSRNGSGRSKFSLFRKGGRGLSEINRRRRLT